MAQERCCLLGQENNWYGYQGPYHWVCVYRSRERPVSDWVFSQACKNRWHSCQRGCGITRVVSARRTQPWAVRTQRAVI